MNNPENNKAAGDFILERRPDAQFTRNEDGTYALITFVQDGIRYEFRTKAKTGRFRFSGKPVSEILTPAQLLGITDEEYARLLNTGSTAPTVRIPADEGLQDGPDKTARRILVYMLDGRLTITERRLKAPARLLRHYAALGTALAFARDKYPDAETVFDERMLITLLNHFGAAAGPKLVSLDGIAEESTVTTAAGTAPRRRIPFAVFEYLTSTYAEYLSCMSPARAADEACAAVNGDGDRMLLKDTAMTALTRGDDALLRRLAVTAVLAHYANGWVETSPHRWTFVTWRDIKEHCAALHAQALKARHQQP